MYKWKEQKVFVLNLNIWDQTGINWEEKKSPTEEKLVYNNAIKQHIKWIFNVSNKNKN